MGKSLVSIIMGAYNCEDVIDQCIDSIITQTYKNWEFIICDDCSTDNTLKILKKYEKKDSRIKILHNERNCRLAASLNICLSVAQGEFIARMDADDISLPERLEKQVDFLEKHPEIDLVGCNRIIFDANGNRGVRKSIEYPTKERLIKGSPFAHPTIVMKKSVYDALGGYTVSKQTMRAEDIDLWIRFYQNGYKGYNMQEVLYCYHESIDDLKKRSLKAAVETAKVYWNGYKVLRFPYYKRFWVVKPIISALIPNRVMKKYYDKNLMKI